MSPGDLKTGGLSNWYLSHFTDPDTGQTFSCVEQFMMISKANLFKDRAIGEQVAQCADPAEMKRLGRQVANYVQSVWEAHREGVVLRACTLKFDQNAAVREQLLGTGRTVLMEVNPRNQVWSIGISLRDALAGVPPTGLGLLGKILMRVRERLRLSRRAEPKDASAVLGADSEDGDTDTRPHKKKKASKAPARPGTKFKDTLTQAEKRRNSWRSKGDIEVESMGGVAATGLEDSFCLEL